jgi:hypothetical protein
MFFVAPELLNRVGDIIDKSMTRVHLAELHMIVASELSAVIVDSVFRNLYRIGELERRTLPLSTGTET